MARGEIYAFLDVDDVWEEGSFQKILEILISNTSIDIVQGLVREEKLPLGVKEDKLMDVSTQPIRDPYYFPGLPSAIYRKAAFEKTGLLDETLRYGEDTDWFLRAWEARVPKKHVDIVFLHYRRHASNRTNNRDLIQLGTAQVYKRRLDRIRHNPSLYDTTVRDFPTFHQYLQPDSPFSDFKRFPKPLAFKEANHSE